MATMTKAMTTATRDELDAACVTIRCKDRSGPWGRWIDSALRKVAVAMFAEVGPRRLVEYMEIEAGREFTGHEMGVIQAAVEAAYPWVDWDAPSHELAGKFPLA